MEGLHVSGMEHLKPPRELYSETQGSEIEKEKPTS